MAAYRPQAVVLVVGADTLGEDPLGRLNLTANAIQAAVRHATLRCYNPLSSSSANHVNIKTSAAEPTSENSGSDSSIASSSSSSDGPSDRSDTRSSICDIDSTSTISGVHTENSSRDPSTSDSSRAAEVPHLLDGSKCRKLPLLLLGGGGYSAAATARAWTCATAAACGPFVEAHILPTQVMKDTNQLRTNPHDRSW